MLQSYYTISKKGKYEKNIQKSQFIVHLSPVHSTEEALSFIQAIRKLHPRANHNCSAYLIGDHDQIQKANDDGEPSGTAGVPMLEVLKKKELKNIAVVVTRYFGGIKLGAGGLIRAYSSSVSEGLEALGIVERTLRLRFECEVEYNAQGKIENDIKHTPYLLIDAQFTEKVTLFISVPFDKKETFENWINDRTNGQLTIHETGSHYLERSIPSFL